MSQQRPLEVGLVAGWGILATWIFQWLFVPVVGVLFWVSEPALKSLLHNGWSSDQIEPYFQGVTTAIPAFFYGVLFGFPLGLLVKRSIAVTWVVFAAAYVAALVTRMLLAAFDIAGVLENLLHPLCWLTLLATLLFSLLGHRARSAYAIRHVAA